MLRSFKFWLWGVKLLLSKIFNPSVKILLKTPYIFACWRHNSIQSILMNSLFKLKLWNFLAFNIYLFIFLTNFRGHKYICICTIGIFTIGIKIVNLLTKKCPIIYWIQGVFTFSYYAGIFFHFVVYILFCYYQLDPSNFSCLWKTSLVHYGKFIWMIC